MNESFESLESHQINICCEMAMFESGSDLVMASLTEMFGQLLSTEELQLCFESENSICLEDKAYDRATQIALELLDVEPLTEEQLARFSTEEVIFEMLATTFEASGIPLSTIREILQVNDYDLEESTKVLSAKCELNPWLPSAVAESPASSTENEIVNMVVDVFSESSIPRSRIIEVLHECSFDIDVAIEVLSKTKSNRKSHKSKSWKKLTPTALSSYKFVSSGVSYAKIASTKSSQQSIRPGNSTTVVSSAIAQPAEEAIDVSVSTTGAADCRGCRFSDEQLQHWRKIANCEKRAMLVEYRLACDLSRSGRSSNAAIAGHISAKGSAARNRWQRAELMCGLLAFKKNNPLVLLDCVEGTVSCKVYQLPVVCSSLRVAIDFHGLVVRHAVAILDAILEYIATSSVFLAANKVHWSSMRLVLVVGRGSHSQDGMARLKPCVARHLASLGVRHNVYEGEILLEMSSISR